MSYVFTHATLFDGTRDMQPQENMTVAVDDNGRISAVGPAASTVGPAGAQEVDLKGAYLMPGLVNLHVHLCGSGKPTSAGAAGDLIEKVVANPVGRWYLHRTLRKHAQQQLASGVTTVRSVGDPGFADVWVRDAINAGKYQGPRLVTSGVGVTVPGGHGAGLFAHIAETPDQAREIESTEGVRVGLEAGVDTIEHGGVLDDELLALFRENGVGRKSSLTCTVSPALPFIKLPPEMTHSTDIQVVNGRIVFDGIVSAAKQALEQGIPVGLGTDSACPYVTQYDMWRELVYFERIVGASRQLALHAATLGNASIIGLGDETGSIEVGKSADMIVLDANPLDDLEALRNVRRVMVRGKFADGLHVKHLPELDRELDKFLPR